MEDYKTKLYIKLKTTVDVKLALRHFQLEVYTFTSPERLETSRFCLLSIYFEIQDEWLLVVRSLKMGVKVCCSAQNCMPG